MKKDLFIKLFKTLLTLSLAFGMAVLMPLADAEAATKPAKPVISVKPGEDGTAVKVTISATERAEGYLIYMKSDIDTKYKKVKNLKKDGTVARSYTFKKLSAGTYSFKVKAYLKNNGKTVKSSYSKVKTVTLKAAADEENTILISDLSKLKAGDVFTFGSYEQDNDISNGKEPIEWIVLSKSDKEILALSKYALDQQKYNEDWCVITWADCTLRKWLNDEFYNVAFNETEKTLIKTKKLKNNDNIASGAEGGEDTKDKVCLLSHEDMVNTAYGFNSDDREYDINRRCTATKYAVAQGVNIYGTRLTAEGEETCGWWLRSVGTLGNCVVCVDDFGYCSSRGGVSVDINNFGVRPAIYINLNP